MGLTQSNQEIMEKGIYMGTCNMSSCKTGEPASWYNYGSLNYYCPSCAKRLSSDEFNKRDAQRLFGHDLCLEGQERKIEELTETELAKKYDNIEDKIPSVWPTYEAAGINLAQDLSFGHWDIKHPELYRVIALVSTRVRGLNITQHLDSKFSFMGLYPHTQKTYDIKPETLK